MWIFIIIIACGVTFSVGHKIGKSLFTPGGF